MAHGHPFVWNNIDAILCSLFYMGELNDPATGSGAYEQLLFRRHQPYVDKGPFFPIWL